MKMELDYIEKLVKLVSDNGLTELSLEEDDKAIIIRKEKEIITTATSVATQHVAAVPVSAASSAAEKPAEAVAKKEESNLLKITSPMVGTFYRAASPGAAPFADVGENVSSGQVVCIIEAMKLMNEIESEVAGKIVEVCVQDGQPVEYGQVLMLVQP